jgi:flagellar basal body L-ring protein FlgH
LFKKYYLLILVFSLSVSSGCAKFLGNLRQDFNDNSDAMAEDFEGYENDPTVGGAWPERGRLNSETRAGNPYAVVGHRDRADFQQGLEIESPRRQNYLSASNTPVYTPETKRLYKHGNRATRDDFIDQSQEEGSLWASSGQTNYYFTKNKIRSPGDLITLTIENDLYRDIGIETKRTLSPREKTTELALLQEQLKTKFIADFQANRKDTLSTSSAAPERGLASTSTSTPKVDATPSPTPVATPSPEIPPLSEEEIQKQMPKATFADVNIQPQLDLKTGETMMGEIIERYPNGNYKIRTVKRIPYKKGPPRLVSVVGIVKSADINDETDIINSGKLYEYRVEVSH